MTNSPAVEHQSNAPVPGTQFLDRGDGRIAYELAGSGPLVITVPGMADLRSTWRHLVPSLVDAGFRVASMDLRGHGDSDTTFSTYDDVAAASDIAALAEHLGGPAIVVGNSMGAASAVIAAAQRPELIAGLALVGPFVRNPQATAWQTWMMRLAMGGPWARRAWMTYFPTFYPTRRDANYTEHRDAVAAGLAQPGHLRAFRATTHLSHAPAEAVLDQVHIQVLVVMGTKDPDFPDQRAEADFIVERLGGRVAMIEGAGHYPQNEFPELTTPEIVGFALEIKGTNA
jgi:pimeloyl-ACP methyl ester carboxylesterase